MGSGNPDVTTEGPTTTMYPNMNSWSLSNVVIIQGLSTGRKKRSGFDPNTEFSTVETTVFFSNFYEELIKFN